MLPVFELFTRLFRTPLELLGRKLNMDAVSASGLLFTLVSCVPTLALVRKMSPKGKIVNGTWIVLNSATFGSQMSFVLGVEPQMATVYILAKLTAGLIALAAVLVYTRKMEIEKER